LPERPLLLPPSRLIHAIIVPMVNEADDILRATIEAILASDFNMKQVIFILAYEGRMGEATETRALNLVKTYKKHFLDAFGTRHPADLPDEIIGKGGNINFAGRTLQTYLKE